MRYVAQHAPVGTAPAKDRVFAEAAGDIVLCLDSHVILGKHAIDAVFSTFSHRDAANVLLHGPLVFDGTNTISTHLNRHWGSGMPGQWGRGWTHRCGFVSAPRRLQDGNISWETIDGECRVVDACRCGNLARGPWDGHESRLRENGWTPIDESSIPSEIGAHGTGLFACRREAWPKFCDGASADMSGFGCEEWHLHDLWRSLGGRVVMTPQLRWRHRFRQKHHEYRPETIDQARNAILWSQRLGRDPATIRQHFPRVDAATWESLTRGERPQPTPPPATSPPNTPPPPCTLVGLNVLGKVASEVGVIDPTGVAFPCLLRAGATKVVVRTTNRPNIHAALRATHEAVRRGQWGPQGFTAHFPVGSLTEAAPTDSRLVVLAKVPAEDEGSVLAQLTDRVRIVAIEPKPQADPGALRAWLRVPLPPASTLAIYARTESDWTAELIGPGTHLHWLIADLGLGRGSYCAACDQRATQMDEWGVTGCSKNREEIIGWLRDAGREAGVTEKVFAAAKMPMHALANPFAWLVDTAIERAKSGV
jgi:hypothetical protein